MANMDICVTSAKQKY